MSIIKAKLINTNAGGGSGITLPINISDVTGLQTALNNKVATVDYNNNNVTLNSAISNKANLIDFTNLQTYVNLPKSYERSFKKTSIDSIQESINGNSSVRILDRVSIVLNKKNDDYIFTSGTNAFIKEINNGVLNYKAFNIRITFYNNVSLGTTPLEIQLWRNTPIPSQVLTTSGSKITNTDTDTRVETSLILTYSKTNTDSFVASGYYIVVKNLSNTIFTYKQLQIDMFISVDKAVIT
jgi:hypothetical protein